MPVVASASLSPIELVSQWTLDQLEAVWAQLQTQITPFFYVLNIDGPLFRMLDDGAKRFIALQFMFVRTCPFIYLLLTVTVTRYRVTEQVMYCRDGTGPDRYFLGAPRHFVSASGMILRPPGSECIWVMRPGAGAAPPAAAAAQPTPAGRKRVLPSPGLAGLVLAVPSSEAVTPPPKTNKIPRPPNAYILYRKERHHLVKSANPSITNNEICKLLCLCKAQLQRKLTIDCPSSNSRQGLEHGVARDPPAVQAKGRQDQAEPSREAPRLPVQASSAFGEATSSSTKPSADAHWCSGRTFNSRSPDWRPSSRTNRPNCANWPNCADRPSWSPPKRLISRLPCSRRAQFFSSGDTAT